jgi:hypothetical protein
MKITFASISMVMWILLLLASIAVAVLASVKAGMRGWPVLARLLPGALLLFGFVSGIIGLYEINNYAATTSFWVSIGVGILGLWLFVSGTRQLRQMLK